MSSYGRHERLPQNDPDDAPQSRFHTIHDYRPAGNGGAQGQGAGGFQGGFGGPGGGNSCANCCTNCINFLPLFCRILVVVTLGGFIAFFFGEVYWNVVLYVDVITSNFLNIYRVLVCTYFGSVIGALFAILHFFQTYSLMEHRKGTIYFMHLWFLVSLCVNLLFFLVFLLLSVMSDDFAFYPSYGPWPTLLGMIPLQLKIDGREEYKVCFCNIPAKYYPWVMLLMLSAFSLITSYRSVPCLLVGLLFGYVLLRFEDYLTLSMSTLRRLESGALSCLTQYSSFVSTDVGTSGNVPEPFSLQRMIMGGGMAQAPPQAQGGGPTGRIYGSGAAGGGSSSSSSSSGGGSEYYAPPDYVEPDTMMEEKDNAQQQPSVFASGGGHRLGGGPAASSSASGSAQPSRFTSFFSRAQPSVPAPRAATTESAAASRIPTKGLNRLVQNAYKQKDVGSSMAGEPEATQFSSSSSSSAGSSSTELSAITVNVGTVDKSPLLAGMTPSDADVPSAPSEAGAESERERNVNRLVALGYSQDDARNALVITDDDFEAAKQFLTTPLTSAI